MQVSTNGGVQPRWRGDSRELYYVEGETLVAVPLITEPEFTVGKAVRLFEHRGINRWGGQQYDVSADGQRFVVTDSVEEEEEVTSPVRIVQNWFAEFRQGVASAGQN